MPTWIIEPRDPLIVRDGRPFGPIPGARAASLDFPFPSTTTGGVRTRDGLDASGAFDTSAVNIERVKKITARGPLLVELNDAGEINDWLVHAPVDALLLDKDPIEENKAIRRRLVTLDVDPNLINLDKDLTPVGLAKPDPNKPCSKAPRYWRWEKFKQWLVNPLEEEVILSALGHEGPGQETRTHVSVQYDTQTAAEGALFQTRGLEFARKEGGANSVLVKRLALAVWTDAAKIKHGLAPLGGERRLVTWRDSKNASMSLLESQCPKEVDDSIKQSHHCRVVLLTPAHFKHGFRPTWLCEQREGVKPELKAIAIGRAQVVSGWDFEKGTPKPTRRLAPAGSVFFLKLTGDADAIERWIKATWMRCISDDTEDGDKERDRRDGFGLAALGVWDGIFREME